MNYPRRMTKCLIAGHKKHLEPTINCIHELDLMHVEDYVAGDESDFDIGAPLSYGEQVSRELFKIRSISNQLQVKPNDETTRLSKTDVSENLGKRLAEIDAEINQNTQKASQLDARLKEIESAQKELLPFMSFDLDLSLCKNYDNLTVFSGMASSLNEARLSEITGAYQLYAESGSKFFILFVSSTVEKEVLSLLSDMGYRESKAPDKAGKPSEIYTALDIEKSEINAQIETLKAELSVLNEKYGNFILASDELLSIMNEKAELPLRIATSEHTFIIEGWIPTDSYDRFVQTVTEKTNNGVYITALEVDLHDEKEVAKIPVEYENPKVTSPLSAVVELYSRPKYTEIDPSTILAISFPLIYGMILGDIGYALILLTLAFLVMKFIKSDAVKSLMMVLVYCQISALIFGIIYGEFMGFALAGYVSHGVHYAGLIPGLETIVFNSAPLGEQLMFPLHRSHMIMTFIVATALFGFFHINAGFIFGFLGIRKNHGLMHAVCEKLSWVIVQLGVIAAIAGWYFIGIPGALAGAAVAVIGVGLLFKGEGIKGLVELPSLLGNILSYTRIIAVGLSSIFIASTFNMLAFEIIWSPNSGFSIMAIFAIFVFVAGHALNSMLSIIAPGLHAIRLQYVEFFGKFYSGGGRAYKPFGHLKKYTMEE
jgi:V/A-type H+-transporting ATPase subunit I